MPVRLRPHLAADRAYERMIATPPTDAIIASRIALSGQRIVTGRRWWFSPLPGMLP